MHPHVHMRLPRRHTMLRPSALPLAIKQACRIWTTDAYVPSNCSITPVVQFDVRPAPQHAHSA